MVDYADFAGFITLRAAAISFRTVPETWN